MLVAAGLDEPSIRERFSGFFTRRGIDTERLEFKDRQTIEDYLALHHAADVLLDSHPFSGHTVSCHTLWMGVPVVTLAGRNDVAADLIRQALAFQRNYPEGNQNTPQANS